MWFLWIITHILHLLFVLSAKLLENSWGNIVPDLSHSNFSSYLVRERWFICETYRQRASQTCSIGVKSREYTSHCMQLLSFLSRVFDVSSFRCGSALSSINRNSGFIEPLKRRTWSRIISLQHRSNEKLAR